MKRNTMKFQLLSDLHADSNPYDIKSNKVDDARFLVLAGDIAHPEGDAFKSIIKDASESYEKVFFVRGNHECYGHGVRRTDYLLNKVFENYGNVVFLNRITYDVDDRVRVVGTTLWSEIERKQMFQARCFISDFRCIKEWSVERNNEEHRIDVAFLQKEIAKALEDKKDLVVITHHAPYTQGTSHPNHDNSPLSSVFATDISHLMSDPPIKVWVYGHTHYSANFFRNGVNIVANQRGMRTEDRKITRFDPSFTFEA